MEWINAISSTSFAPERVRNTLLRISESWLADLPPLRVLLESFGERKRDIVHLIAVSPVSSEKLVRDPEALVWLSEPEVLASSRGIGRMRKDLEELSTKPPQRVNDFTALRRWKQREMLRIALRDVGGIADVEQTTLELSQLAEICVREITDRLYMDLVRRLGEPGTPFVMLGMGKFGGNDLNYSSDIDVVFYYGETGQLASGLTRQEFFARLMQKIIEVFKTTDPAGPLFRIDLRLRPEGDAGLLVRSLDSMENYYAAFGETWERMALSKARIVAGDDELAYEFSQRLQAFIYPRSVGPEMIEEVAHIKGRIEREIVGETNLHRNVKLGRGGIREIEFISQSLQLLHGSRHAFLQERGTLKSLHALQQLDLLPREAMETLIRAYRFLRITEHRLQIVEEAQTHTLPDSPQALELIAQSLACSGLISGDNYTEAFLRTLETHTTAVREIFEAVMKSDKEETILRDVTFFENPARAQKSLQELGEGSGSSLVSPRTRKLFGRLEPELLHAISRTADPDATLTRFLRFTERYGLRGALYETLLVNPRVMELLIKLFDSSAFLSEIAIRRPQLVEEVARLGNLGDASDVDTQLTGLARNDENLPWQDWVRVYRRAQQLRIGLRDLLGFATLPEVFAEHTALADACLLFTQRQLKLEDQLTVVSLGKFGGQELGYGADLDVVFIGSDPAAGAQLVRAMTEQSGEGRVFAMDARLRPEGEKGELAVTLGEWRDYFSRGRGGLWEAQALTKARPISGPLQEEFLESAQSVWRQHGQREDLFPEIAAMLSRVAEHRGGNPLLDFKTGPCGLMRIEFFVQANQMRSGVWEPNTLRALDALSRAGALSLETTQELAAVYLWLRQLETVLRRMNDTPVSRLPEDTLEQKRLAIRCGFASASHLLDQMKTTSEVIQRWAALKTFS